MSLLLLCPGTLSLRFFISGIICRDVFHSVPAPMFSAAFFVSRLPVFSIEGIALACLCLRLCLYLRSRRTRVSGSRQGYPSPRRSRNPASRGQGQGQGRGQNRDRDRDRGELLAEEDVADRPTSPSSP